MPNARSLILILTLLLTVGAAPLAFGQAPFEPFEVSAELAVPPDPVTPATLSLTVRFAPGPPSDGINPAGEAVVVEIQPPTPVQPPEPVHPDVTAWHLLLPPGCFMERPNGQFRVEDSVGCGASLQLFFDNGDIADVSEGVVSLDASFKPPSGNKSEWRFQLDVELVEVPPTPIVPPQPIRGSTLLTVGDDIGEAVHSLVRWEGVPPDPI
jgi:hypothetical protein